MHSIIAPMHVGQNIRQARVTKGLTQEELALRVNKSRPLISHIEQTGKVNAYTLRDICEALDVSVEDMENTQRDTLDPAVTYLKKVDLLTEENAALRKEINELRELIASQRQLIDAFVNKKKN